MNNKGVLQKCRFWKLVLLCSLFVLSYLLVYFCLSLSSSRASTADCFFGHYANGGYSLYLSDYSNSSYNDGTSFGNFSWTYNQGSFVCLDDHDNSFVLRAVNGTDLFTTKGNVYLLRLEK